MKKTSELYNLIGKNIKNCRKLNGDTQENLAEKLGKTRGYISRIEAPGVKSGLSIDLLFDISKLYNVDIRIFFEEYDNLFISKKRKKNNTK